MIDEYEDYDDFTLGHDKNAASNSNNNTSKRRQHNQSRASGGGSVYSAKHVRAKELLKKRRK
jgi:hypothetical protein